MTAIVEAPSSATDVAEEERRGAARARRAAVGVVVFCATLPLQWQTLASVPGLGTLRWFHLGIVPMLVLAAPAWRDIWLVVRRSRPVPEGMIAFIACNLVTAVAYQSDPADFLQRTAYCVAGLVFGACLLAAMRDSAGRRVLAYASVVTVVVFSWSFYRAMVAARVNPWRTIERAVVSGDPSVIEFSLFRTSFNANSDQVDVRSNARHEIFAALVIVLAVSLVAGAVNRSARIVLVVSSVLTAALVFISQSRSVLLACALAVGVALVRAVLTRRIRAGTVVLAVVVVAGAVAAFPVLGNLVLTRLTQTQSYDSRIGAFADQLTTNQIVERLLVGGPRLEKSTHNIIGDGALRGGVLGGLGAIVIVFAIVLILTRCIKGFLTAYELGWFAAVLGLSVTLVRCFTAGGGQLQLPEWCAVGLALVVVIRAGQADRRRAEAEAAAAPPPAPARRRARISAGPTARA